MTAIPANIVIADDDQDDQMLMRQALQEITSECHIVSVYNGFELLDLLKVTGTDSISRPDFILLDINMPLMNGFTALSEIKKTDTLSGIPVFIMSTSHSRADRKIAVELGAAGFYTKPVEFEELRRMLREIISGTLHLH